MKAEIISVGTELLLGHTVNTDAAFIARELAALGIDLMNVETVGDNPGRLREVLETALSRSDLVITSGGLGPTLDDLTKKTIADTLGLPLVEDKDSLARLTTSLSRPCFPREPQPSKIPWAPRPGALWPRERKSSS